MFCRGIAVAEAWLKLASKLHTMAALSMIPAEVEVQMVQQPQLHCCGKDNIKAAQDATLKNIPTEYEAAWYR